MATKHLCGIPGCPLTGGELRALELLARGESYVVAAKRLGMGATTLRTQRFQACRRLGVSTAAQALVICLDAGWLDPIKADPHPPIKADPLPKADPHPLGYVDEPVSWGQRLYLEAFDQHLRAWAAGDEVGERRTRRLMDFALPGALAGARVRRRSPRAHPLERMARWLIALDR